MNETVLFCAYKSVLCEGMTLETQYLGSRPTRACELKFSQNRNNALTIASRPTRACELKFKAFASQAKADCHALHGRVS